MMIIRVDTIDIQDSSFVVPRSTVQCTVGLCNGGTCSSLTDYTVRRNSYHSNQVRNIMPR